LYFCGVIAVSVSKRPVTEQQWYIFKDIVEQQLSPTYVHRESKKGDYTLVHIFAKY